jgi:excinuclease ABC subunit A
MELSHVLIRGAREHNLRSIDVKIPKKKLVVLTGVSGSGKSSLAFDTLYADGQRRYVESLSAYARQFLGQMEKPKYDSIRGLSPTISIEQKTAGSNPRSTVGTMRIRVDGEIALTEDVPSVDKRKKHTIEVVVDRIVVKNGLTSRVTDSVETALRTGQGVLIAATPGTRDRVFSEKMACGDCGISFPELTPQSFSFNSPQGMCVDCNGLGNRVEIDPRLVVPDDSLSIDEGAIKPWGPDVSEKSNWTTGYRAEVCAEIGVDMDRPWRRLSKRHRDLLLYGSGNRELTIEWSDETGEGTFDMLWEGAIPRLTRRFLQASSDRAKRWHGQWIGDARCSSCGGHRIRPESAAVQLGTGKKSRSIVEVSAMTVEEALRFFDKLQLRGSALEIASEVLKEVCARLNFLASVGLGYLSLDRAGPSLSGGESQRIRLASQVGSELTGVIYILDEPSIGLHQRDNKRLLTILTRMRDIGNTVVVVEHDEETIRAADHVIDFGPGAGVAGGRIVHAGTPKSLEKNRRSLTGAYLSGRVKVAIPDERRQPMGSIKVSGANQNNLDNLDVEIPLGVLTAVTGVSGAGKSTLINDIVYPALARKFHAATRQVGQHRSIHGLEQLDKVISIDQRPIGRTPRSNPATYIKMFDEIRQFFAQLPEARIHGYKPGRFSFNVKGGRCEACQGDGVRKIEMHFLADVYVKCEECDGRRFNDATLRVNYKGKSIADVLELTVKEAADLFAAHPKIAAPLGLLTDVGLDYLHLGQPSPTLSGGEAQRIKLARELSKRATGRTLYLLDEPTTGLHFDDVRKLLAVLARLVESGNTIIVIEHNLDVIKTADWIIDLGPEGGPDGGRIVAQGTPESVARVKQSHTGRHLGKLLRAQTRASRTARRR